MNVQYVLDYVWGYLRYCHVISILILMIIQYNNDYMSWEIAQKMMMG